MKQKEDKNFPATVYMVVISLIVFCVCFFYPLVLPEFIVFFDLKTEIGEFGDQYGAVNAFFSGLAFAGLIVAILMQRQELSLQRQELEMQRDEMRGTKEALQAQSDTLRQQQFDNSFFNMLSLHNEITQSIRWGTANTMDELKGRNALARMLSNFRINWINNTENDVEKRACITCNNFFDDLYKNQLNHYINNMLRILVLIKSSNVQNYLFYSKLLQAQLSRDEIVILYYYCFFHTDGDNFKQLAIKYKLFNDLTETDLFDKKHFKLQKENQ